MSITDAAGDDPRREAADPAPEQAEGPETLEEIVADAQQHEVRVPIAHDTEQEVTLQRSVRYGRVLVGTAVLGAVVAALACLLFPIPEDAEYTMGQVVGFMALIGAAIGLAVGGVLSLVLGFVARRSAGTGIAIQTDVR